MGRGGPNIKYTDFLCYLFQCIGHEGNSFLSTIFGNERSQRARFGVKNFQF